MAASPKHKPGRTGSRSDTTRPGWRGLHLVLAGLFFAAGFVSGVAFTVYKTGGAPARGPAPASQAALQERVRMLRAELAANPENAAAWIQLGHLYFDADAFREAIEAYEMALTLTPDNADVLTDLGIMYRRSGDARKALESFDRAVAVSPDHQNARFNKGIVLLHDLDDRAAALEAWEALLEINPSLMVGENQSLAQLVEHYRNHR